MEEIKNGLYRVSLEELKAKGKFTDRETFRFHCPLCGEEDGHRRRFDGSFNQKEGVGQCFCCGARFVVDKGGAVVGYRSKTVSAQPPVAHPRSYRQPDESKISLGPYPESIMAYLKERGLKADVMHRLGVGWAKMPFGGDSSRNIPPMEKSFLAFRFLEDGVVRNVQYKSPDKDFLFEKGCRILPWNIDAVRDAQTVYITEGMMDAAVMVQCGYEATISLSNGCGTSMSSFDPYKKSHFCGKKIVYAGDTDMKGIEKRQEVAKYFADSEFWYVEWAEGKDANDMLMAGGEEMVRWCVESNVRELPAQGVATVVDQMEALNELIRNGVPRFPGISLHGFSHLVRFEPGRLMVISGFPGAGKSSFADYVMMSLAVEQGWRAAVYSPEKYPMSLHYYELAQILMGREMSQKNFTPQAIERGLRFLRENIFHISEECSQIEDIIATATRLVRQKHIRTLLLDPFNYIDLPVLSGANDTQKISHVLKQIVDFAHQQKVLVILVAHPKKPQTDGGKRQEPLLPSLYDIAGSADFYNKCDYGIILQRQKNTEMAKAPQLTWVHVLKIRFRHLGQIGRRAFGFDAVSGRFVGTENDNMSLREFDRSDWSYREAEQQMLDFDAAVETEEEMTPEDDLPF